MIQINILFCIYQVLNSRFVVAISSFETTHFAATEIPFKRRDSITRNKTWVVSVITAKLSVSLLLFDIFYLWIGVITHRCHALITVHLIHLSLVWCSILGLSFFRLPVIIQYVHGVIELEFHFRWFSTWSRKHWIHAVLSVNFIIIEVLWKCVYLKW